MRKRSDINWSEVIRDAIAKRIEAKERLEAAKKIDELKQKMIPVERGSLTCGSGRIGKGKSERKMTNLLKTSGANA